MYNIWKEYFSSTRICACIKTRVTLLQSPSIQSDLEYSDGDYILGTITETELYVISHMKLITTQQKRENTTPQQFQKKLTPTLHSSATKKGTSSWLTTLNF